MQLKILSLEVLQSIKPALAALKNEASYLHRISNSPTLNTPVNQDLLLDSASTASLATLSTGDVMKIKIRRFNQLVDDAIMGGHENIDRMGLVVGELQKALTEIKTDLLGYFRAEGFSHIEPLLALEIGVDLHALFNDQAKSQLQFFQRAFAPQDYKVFDGADGSLVGNNPDIAGAMDSQIPFLRPVGTFSSAPPSNLAEEKHGVELCIPSGSKLIVIKGLLNASFLEKSLPLEFQSRMALVKDALGVDSGGDNSSGGLDPRQFLSAIKDMIMAIGADEDAGMSLPMLINDDIDLGSEDSDSDYDGMEESGSRMPNSAAEASDSNSVGSDDSDSEDSDVGLAPKRGSLKRSRSEVDSDDDQDDIGAPAAKRRRPIDDTGDSIGARIRARREAEMDDVNAIGGQEDEVDSSGSDSDSPAPIVSRLRPRRQISRPQRFGHDDADDDMAPPSKRARRADTPRPPRIPAGPTKPSAEFTKLFLERLSLRDLLTLDAGSVKEKHDAEFQLWTKISKQAPHTLIRDFMKATADEQHTVLALLYAQGREPTATILLESLPKSDRDTMFLSLPNPIQTKVGEELQKMSVIAQQSMDDGEGPADMDVIRSKIMLSGLDEKGKRWALKELALLEATGPDDHSFSNRLERMKLVADIPVGKRIVPPVSISSPIGERMGHIQSYQNSLDKAVFGQQKVKDKLMQFAMQRISNPDTKGVCILLVGPPGTGKTTVAREGVAKGLGMHFAEIPLAGMDDSGHLIGHGFTYVNSKHGEILRHQVEAGHENLVYFMDEVDKIGTGSQGRAIMQNLIQITDFSQNDAFRDNYVPEVRTDLSRCIFIFTANDINLIDRTLLNRMNVIQVNAQSLQEKVQIGLQFQFPKAVSEAGFRPDDVVIGEEEMAYLTERTPWEAGSRVQQRIIEDLVQKINSVRMTQMRDSLFSAPGDGYNSSIRLPMDIPQFNIPLRVTKALIDQALADLHIDMPHTKDTPQVGEVNGLYATTAGDGGILPIQVRFLTEHGDKGKGEFILTGNQGSVMKESMQCARTVAGEVLGESLSSRSFHVHATDTSCPKDGPSAGGAITICMISAATGIPIKNEVAMTGEIDIRGNITKIGGVYEKLQGAKQAGVKHVFLPKENEHELQQAVKRDPDIVKGISITLVSRIEELMEGVLVRMPTLPLGSGTPVEVASQTHI